MAEYTEGIQGDTVLILKDGVALHVSEILKELNKTEILRDAMKALLDNAVIYDGRCDLCLSYCNPAKMEEHLEGCSVEQAQNALKETG